jgi:hypothetical protein
MNITNIKTFQNTAKFNRPYFLQSAYVNEIQKTKDEKSRIIIEKVNGYIRQYLVKEDGTKILISEMRDDVVQSSPTQNESNANNLMDLLNYSTGVRPPTIKAVK